jgi:arginyl-tRNA synthetase
MNLYAEFQDLIASILRQIAASGRLPEDLDLARFVVEPPRDPAHGSALIVDALELVHKALSFDPPATRL